MDHKWWSHFDLGYTSHRVFQSVHEVHDRYPVYKAGSVYTSFEKEQPYSPLLSQKRVEKLCGIRLRAINQDY